LNISYLGISTAQKHATVHTGEVHY